ncbi:hypothetical protein [Riemerella anatipestifer]|uniref:Phage protein n=2 Tax=Riemerella anatipestifer TaxID=34085 RepID=J9R0M8_RIEAN|nr:hypothetical protein [Riemerella anatipestifer]AFR36545.1 hypothetical protein B739_1963 [Riemerella anatipestifer RA-CH-1]AIH01339.1 hypothetical protein M949_0168 [Riemerella anatipestifer CH3]AZZ57773.1 hypothetical protein AWB57_01200 [Riemerella anatipestifer]AZZ59737.1 hypothetical protein AWB57_12355 [Riemerella anatipestifer]MBT0573862.1 hypothetical protein [Riemerella anatipestifer]
MDFKDKLNNILLSNIGVVIMTGTEELLAFPERKEVMENDWAEENGGDYDLSSPKFKDKEVTLKMAILADDNVQFWQYYNTLFAELKKEGELSLYVFDHDQTYKVFYKKSGNFKKVLKRLKNVEKVFVKFDLTFKVLF